MTLYRQSFLDSNEKVNGFKAREHNGLMNNENDTTIGLLVRQDTVCEVLMNEQVPQVSFDNFLGELEFWFCGLAKMKSHGLNATSTG